MGLLLVAVVAIGIFALPSTMALFGGQHNWYDLGPAGNDVPCEKCHADVFDELSNSGPHVNMECWFCHRTGSITSITYASGEGNSSVPGQEAHAASTVECMACHIGFTAPSNHPSEWDQSEDCVKCHGGKFPAGNYILEAGGFGLVTWNSSDTGAKAAHKAFVDNASSDPLMDGANEACITCHTHVAIDINWTHKYLMSLDADGSNGTWVLSGFSATGNYNQTTYGNMTGGNTGVTDPVVDISPTPVGYDPSNP